VVLEYVHFLKHDEDDNCVASALHILETLIREPSPKSASIYILYAKLNSGICESVLQRAAQDIPIHQQPDHYRILEQLFCVYIARLHTSSKSPAATSLNPSTDATKMVSQLLDRIILLSPGLSVTANRAHAALSSSSTPSDDVILADIPNLPIACRCYVQYLVDENNMELFRKVYQQIFFESNIVDLWISMDSEAQEPPPLTLSTQRKQSTSTGQFMRAKEATTPTGIAVVQDILDCVLEMETDRGRRLRVYNVAIQIFRQHVPSWVHVYQQRKVDEMVTPLQNRKSNIAGANILDNDNIDRPFQVPVLDMSDSNDDMDTTMADMYQRFHIVLVKNATAKLRNNDDSTPLTKSLPKLQWGDIGSIFHRLNDIDQASWCVERSSGNSSSNEGLPTAEKFLSTKCNDRSYCSFLVQNSCDVYEDTVQRLPFESFSVDWSYEPALWFFVGRNSIGYPNLDGRPEHTDAILHDGTWHYQLSGAKRWWVRPTPELVKLLQKDPLMSSFDENSKYYLDCKEGDVLVINTRLWFHRTVIPPQRVPSVSFARDFRFNSPPVVGRDASGSCMTNVDGLYATNDIETGTILFTESDMPDCELHRSSTDPNCEVVELEDGTSAVISTRAISAGEFFCVQESSDEEYSDALDTDIEGDE
jgi:hypothetical protein